MSTLVLGAGGFLGLNIVDALVAAGSTPRCGRRVRSNVIPLRSRKLPMVVADLEQPETLREAMRDTKTVVHAAGYYPRLSLDYEGAIRIGRTQLENVLDAAAASGVERVVYVSSTATIAPRADGSASTEADGFASVPGFGLYHDLKWTMESIALAEQRLEVVIACPGACIGPWDLRVGTSALVVGIARGVNPPHPDGIVNIVDARDVGQLVAKMALSTTSVPKRVLMAAHNRQVHPMLESLAKRYGVAPPSAPLRADEAKALAFSEESRAAECGGRPAVSREIVDLIVHGAPVDASLATQALGARFRSWTETLDAFDDWARRMRLIPEQPGYWSTEHGSESITQP
ncbi:MAG: NAD(P)H-binding protein [Deltaproteobacteria bacterium]|nr:NAD(P)H-binding protein [Deltaproteobacteria bacterium]